ncbi:hypothetical protein KFE94_11960 [bacterium SCSIO 12643]|nr:hypothetical protein KFE94_11960 [bacterium SCSIO 12643]
MALLDEILNSGLNLSMEFGKNLRQPINNRLIKLFPNLSNSQLEMYNSECSCARDYGLNLIYDLYSKNTWKVDGKKIENEFCNNFKNKYPWVSDSNLVRLFNQGSYYACK